MAVNLIIEDDSNIISEEYIDNGKLEHAYFIDDLRAEINMLKTGRVNRIKDNATFTLKEDEPKKSQEELECELLLSMMEKKHGGSIDRITYWKQLKKRIPTFKKEVFNNLSKEDKHLIQLLNNYTLKLINQSIKNNIEDWKACLADDDDEE